MLFQRLLLASLFLLSMHFLGTEAFSSRWGLTSSLSTSTSTSTTTIIRSTTILSMSTVVEPPPTRTTPGTKRPGTGNDEGVNDNDSNENYDEFYIRKHGPPEYLEDNPDQERGMDDPFHILLMAETYRNPKVTTSYVASSVQYVLEMPFDEAIDSAVFAKDNGFSVLGKWSRKECLKLSKQLQLRDLAVRVVPYAEGGKRSWQAGKDGSDAIDVGYNVLQ